VIFANLAHDHERLSSGIRATVFVVDAVVDLGLVGTFVDTVLHRVAIAIGEGAPEPPSPLMVGSSYTSPSWLGHASCSSEIPSSSLTPL
jgi:hypothetical protein